MPSVPVEIGGVACLPEAAINLRCIRAEPLDAMSDLVDWRAVVEYAQVHGVVQFLADAVARRGIAVPADVRVVLQRQQQQNATRAMLQHAACQKVLEAFEAQDVPAVAFKGTTLSKLLYGRVADRSSCDIDLLVGAGALIKAREVLLADGWQPADAIARLDLDVLLERGNEMAFVDANATILELHWQLFESNRAARFPMVIEGLRMEGRRLADADHFLILVLHGLSHHWAALKWVVDIDAFVCNVPLPWDEVLERARATGALRATRIALLLAHALFDTPLPCAIDDRVAHRLAVRYARGIAAGAAIPPVLDFPMQLRAREQWRDRVRFLRFVAQPRLWDRNLPSRFARLIAQSFRRRRLADVQKISGWRQP